MRDPRRVVAGDGVWVATFVLMAGSFRVAGDLLQIRHLGGLVIAMSTSSRGDYRSQKLRQDNGGEV
jgi:hypothetical protein